MAGRLTPAPGAATSPAGVVEPVAVVAPECGNERCNSMMGVNINDAVAPFTGMILAGDKTVETRRSRSLDSVIGKRVGIVQTGLGTATLVGFATVCEPVHYETLAAFRAAFRHHRVAAGSKFDGAAWGYPLVAVEAAVPRPVKSRGSVLRRID